MPAGYCTFTKDATTFDVKAYLYGWKDELVKFQTEEYTEGGDLLVQELAPSFSVKVFSFEGLADAEVADLRNFYDNIVNGKELSFTFTDSDGSTEYTMRWMDPLFDPVMQSYNSWSLIVRLRVES